MKIKIDYLKSVNGNLRHNQQTIFNKQMIIDLTKAFEQSKLKKSLLSHINFQNLLFYNKKRLGSFTSLND